MSHHRTVLDARKTGDKQQSYVRCALDSRSLQCMVDKSMFNNKCSRPECRNFVRRSRKTKQRRAYCRVFAAVLECTNHACHRCGWNSAALGRRPSSRTLAQSWFPPRLRCFPGKSTSGCTTRMWRVSASLRENVFSSTHSAQRTFCFRALWIVSS